MRVRKPKLVRAVLLQRLAGVTAVLGLDALDLLVAEAQRLQVGRARYGTLSIEGPGRLWDLEEEEELLDALIYRRAGRIRQQRRERRGRVA